MQLFKKNDRTTLLFQILVIFGICVLVLRFLIYSNTFHSSLLYLAFPFTLSLLLYYFSYEKSNDTWRRRFWNNTRSSLIILFACSLVLMEGYVCVVMFLPIYFFGVFLAFIVRLMYESFSKNSLQVNFLVAAIALASLEGVNDLTTFERYNEVTVSEFTNASINDIKQHLKTPAKPTAKRHWLLSVFPMPKNVGNIKIAVGETRIYEFEYNRWFKYNTHKGALKVTLLDVSKNRFTTKIEDTSYLSTYMNLRGTELTLEPMQNGATQVIFKIKFDRKLDPIWYFQPLQRFAVKKSAQYFIHNLLSKNTDGTRISSVN